MSDIFFIFRNFLYFLTYKLVKKIIMKTKYWIILLVIVGLIVAAYLGSYVLALGVFLFKLMLGVVALVIFVLGILIGRFFPYKSKKQILNG